MRSPMAMLRHRVAAGPQVPEPPRVDGRRAKTVALALATLIAAPAFTKSAVAARARDASQWEQNYNGYYRGYPLEDWYRTDGW